MLTRYLVSPIEPPKFTTRIGSAVLPAILTSIGPSVFPTILAAIFLPYIARLRHTNIISTASATVSARSAIYRSRATVERTRPPVIRAR